MASRVAAARVAAAARVRLWTREKPRQREIAAARVAAARLYSTVQSLSPTPCALLQDLIASEPDKAKQFSLIALRYAFEAQNKEIQALKESQEALKESQEALKESQDKEILLFKALKESQDKTISALEESKTAMRLEYLRLEGLNGTRGLFEYLQGLIIEGNTATKGMKGSEATWAKVLQCNIALERCLRQHLGPNVNLPAHLAGTYQFLSQHIHAGKHLSQHKGTILFQPDYLSPEQCQSLVCMGQSAGISVQPDKKRSLPSP